MDTETSLTRRLLLQMTVAFGGLTLAGPASLAAAEEIHKWALLEVTPGTVSGPFYPLLNKPADRDADLTVIKGRKERAQGQVLQVVGQVFNIKRTPVKGVQVELWQANAAGRYDHPADPNTAPLDPNFQGYGVAVTDGEGRYRFKTIMPGAYPVVPGWDPPASASAADWTHRPADHADVVPRSPAQRSGPIVQRAAARRPANAHLQARGSDGERGAGRQDRPVQHHPHQRLSEKTGRTSTKPAIGICFAVSR